MNCQLAALEPVQGVVVEGSLCGEVQVNKFEYIWGGHHVGGGVLVGYNVICD